MTTAVSTVRRPGRVVRRLSLRRWAAAGVALLAAGTTLAACGGPSSYHVTAIFPSAEGLFPGNAVQVLGVGRGSVTSVTPEGGRVVVGMEINGSQALPATVRATLRAPELLGEPSIELSPGYSHGPRLAAGSTIPISRTSVPESTDQLLRDMQRYLGQIDAPSLGGLVANLAQDLQGQGQNLNQLIAGTAGTLQALADKGSELGQLNGSLAQITGTLKQRTASVATLLQAYSSVAHVLSTESGPLGDSITQLAEASQQLAALLAPNLTPLQSDIGTITQVGRTLDRNLGSLDQGLSSSVALFAAAQRAYDPVHKWLNLNSQIAPGTTSGVLAGLVRDRLAGVCRRVLANHASGLSSSQLQTLRSCGDPNSGYFDALLGAVPTILTAATGGQPSAPSPQDLLSQGAAQIPGLSQSQSQALGSISPSALSGPTTTTTPPAATAPTSPPLTTDQQANSSGGGLLGGLLHGLVGSVSSVGHFFGSVGHFFGSLL